MAEPPVGTWHSVYTYESSSRGQMTDERDVELIISPVGVIVTSLPGDPSRLDAILRFDGRLLTGTWRERTDRDGFYGGAVFRGGVQFILAADLRSAAGRWVGHSRDLTEVNSGTWALTYAGERVDAGGV